MKTILFYSFKGGTGRTTASANVAAALAMMGKRVLCVDLDIEGPGMHILFKHTPHEPVIQDYLNESDLIDIEDMIVKVNEINQWKVPGEIHFIPAMMGVEKPVNYSGENVYKALKGLIDSRTDDYDYMIMDSASGYGDMSTPSMRHSNHIILLFKLSLQHVAGTAVMAPFFEWLCNKTGNDFSLVACNVPIDNKTEGRIGKVLDALEETTGKRVLETIPEDNNLKWEEKVIVIDKNSRDSNAAKAYMSLAKKIDQLGNKRS